jgi:uncharacterized membrane protein YecN with MAPEG domain
VKLVFSRGTNLVKPPYANHLRLTSMHQRYQIIQQFIYQMSHNLGISPQFPLLPVTGTWCLPITLYYISLSGRVVWQRKQTWTVMGDRSNNAEDLLSDPLHTAIRAQSNFLETIPIALILAAAAELNGASKKHLSWSLATLLTLRVVHCDLGLLRPGTRGFGRLLGYWGSLFWMAGVGSWGAWLSKEQYWKG